MNFGYNVFSPHVIVWGLLVSSEPQLPIDLDRVSLAFLNQNNGLHCIRSEPLRGRHLAMYSTRFRCNLLLPANVRTNSTKRQHLCHPQMAILEAS